LLLFAGLTVPALWAAQTVDRIAVVVGGTPITASEVLEEVRLTEFLNGEPPNTGPEQLRAAAERLIDQQLLRKEMEVGQYPAPPPSEGEQMLRNFQRERYPDEAQFRGALEKFSLTENQVKQHLLWQISVLRFTETRFAANVPAGDVQTDPQGANRARDAADAPSGNAVDQQLENWLKETRAQTRIEFKKEAFQ
jgi:hypothetical protein